MKIALNTFIFLFLSFNILFSQDKTRDKVFVLRAEVINGDTIPHVDLREVIVTAKIKFKNKKDEIAYTKLVRNVKIALPYARIAGAKLYEINEQLAQIKDDKGRKQFMKQAEKDIQAEFEGQIRKLTFSQGKILIKLIDRETGNTGYELIKEYRGSVSAFFWQGIARVFGANLKDGYNTDNNEDAMIERIVKLIDMGAI